ncbi:MAG: MBL fold metallo-hydrolase [Gemmatimonadaceae bacterium]|nr:MBL fold metallo-hydrolase [Gemmatimonadaceae bacterium]
MSADHSSPRRFANRHLPDRAPQGVLRWQLQRLRDRLPRPPRAPITGVVPDVAWLQANRTVTSLTWIGHSSLLYQRDGVNVLFDPVFSAFASPVQFAGPRRHQPPGLALAELPHVDVVLLSHAHYDHLDLPSVRALARQPGGSPTFLVPLGLDSWFARHVRGARVRACAWDDVVSWPGRTTTLELHFLAVQHWSNRTPWDRNRTLWGSWAIVDPGFRFWFSGDLGYSRDTQEIGARFGRFDLAAIAIGAYEPRWFMRDQHLNPDEAVRVMGEVGAERAIGIHWGTFALTDESLDEPPRALAAAVAAHGLASDRFDVMRHGETRRY